MNLLLNRLRQAPVTATTLRRALDEAAAWLARAQDASGCGGVCAHYDAKRRAWAGAYPETTGYIIPTLLRYAEFSGKDDYRQRALRMATWESHIQLPEGGVRAGTLDATTIAPTIFNTGQVLLGWFAAWQATHDPVFHDSMVRAADWLVAAQDEDGAWRRFASPFASHALNTYNTRVAFALAATGQALDEPRYVAAAVRNVSWALTQMRPNGWLANNDLQDNERPLTHTIAYATRGMLEVGRIADNAEFIAAAERIARVLLGAQRADGALPGRLDADWRPASRWTCLTGNAQVAIIWQLLAGRDGDPMWMTATDHALHYLCARQDPAAANLVVRGALAGSHPRRGEYMRHRYPNWAAKFFMDALLLRLEAAN